MARSAADATRFTATGPYAHSRGNVSTINIGSAPPANETPQQKVARLREAARQARLGQESRFDKIVLGGRKWADRAHKTTVTALIGLSVLSGGIAVYATVDMIMYNRKKRREWFAEQQAKYDQALARARTAEADGSITPDLALILNKERAIEQADAERRQRKGLWQGAKEWVFGGMAKTERPSGAIEFASEDLSRMAAGLSTQTRPTEVEGQHADMQGGAFAQRVGMPMQAATAPAIGSRGKNISNNVGGPLDQLGDQAAASIRAAGQSWTDWLRRR